MTFAARFWRGELGFLAVVAILLGISVVFSLATPHLPTVLIYPALSLFALVSVWQAVGAVRYAERVMREGALSRVYGAYATMGVAVVVNGVLALGLLLPKPELSLDVEGQVPRVAVSGAVAEITGPIDYRALTELKSAVAASDVSLVRLHSAGGNVIAGRSIGLFIAREELATEVLHACYSACTLAFMGGVSRRLGPEGVLGFHGYRFDSTSRVQTVDRAEIAAKDRVYLSRQGVDAGFISRIFETPPEALWRPGRAELQAAGVLR